MTRLPKSSHAKDSWQKANDFCKTGLADDNVRTTFDHRANTATVGGPVAKARCRDIVDKNRWAAGGGFPGVGSAAQCMHSRIADTERLPVVDKNIGGTLSCRTDNHMRTTGLAMDTERTKSFIADSACWRHIVPLILIQSLFQRRWHFQKMHMHTRHFFVYFRNTWRYPARLAIQST